MEAREKKVSVIIAARNEENRIGNVLKIVCNHPMVDDVVVVCDGCTDNTVEVARKYKAHVHVHKDSLGKTLAVKYGLKYAKNDVVMLLDADLKHLTAENVTDLAIPVLTNLVDWTLSIRGNSSNIYKWFKMDFVSGERCIKKKMLADYNIWTKPRIGYGLEVLMNDSFLDRGKTFISVYLPNLYATPKHEKMDYWQGVMADFRMVGNIFRAFPFYRVGLQFLEMAALNNRYRRFIKKYSHEEA